MKTVAATCRSNLAAIVGAYRKATGASITAVSKKFYGNSGFLGSFLAGKQSMSVDKFDEVVQKVQADWPAGATWPPTRAIVIARPEKLSPEK